MLGNSLKIKMEKMIEGKRNLEKRHKFLESLKKKKG